MRGSLIAATREHRIAVMPGDGIGPEVVREALRVLDVVARVEGFSLDLLHLPDSGDHYLETGEIMTPQTIESLRGCESLLLGAVGHATLPSGFVESRTNHVLVHELDLSIGVRPAELFADHLTPLKGVSVGDLDITIVRPTNEGEIAIRGGSLQKGSPYEAAVSLDVHTRFGVDRVLRHGFELAGTRRRRLAVVAQANANTSHKVWEAALEGLQGEYPDVATEFLYPDHAAMQLVREPERFDVLATTLIIGGIFTDLLGALIGGIGLIGSVRWNPETRFGLYEPAHGSAPKYTGKNMVSPIATFRALAMLLDNLGERSAATRIDEAIRQVFRTGTVSDPSSRSALGTVGTTDAVLAAIADPQPAG
ncbi:MAG TPA: isocitrate/isopropylmalate family dehydrogenase [Acidimicrobiales bacterium]|nr:isocitrate/isopropylmalate family dehydrogenase [Acidimicrobiales bacterium]